MTEEISYSGMVQIWGGFSYALPENVVLGGEVFPDVETAAREWKMRRNSPTDGRFPMWGDQGPEGDALLILDADGDTVEVLTVAEMVALDSTDDIEHYYDLESWNDSANGYCDECGAEIADGGEGEARFCPKDSEHDPYSDGFMNGGDPFEIEDDDGDDVPLDHPVRPLLTDEEVAAAKDPMTCFTCHRTWDDGISTGMTPVPSGRCPFEYYHNEDEEESSPWT